jgi:hypothetical protein
MPIARPPPSDRLGYDSQLETPHQRGSGRAQKIRRRLGSGIDDPFGEFPARPKGMHWRTYERWRRIHVGGRQIIDGICGTVLTQAS